MPEHVLHDFITTVPSCVQADHLAVALEVFELGQCDRLVVVNDQQCPVGVLYAAHLMPQLMRSYGCSVSLDAQRPLWTLNIALIEPTAVLPAELSVKQFEFYLRSQQSPTNTRSDWVLVDSSGKYLGLLDSTRVLRFLASLPADKERVKYGSSRQNRFKQRAIDSLIQLLELLPWPLMLQTGTGEVVKANPVWRQQFKAFDPEAVRHEVEEILKGQPEEAPGSQDIGHYLQNIAGEQGGLGVPTEWGLRAGGQKGAGEKEDCPLAIEQVSFAPLPSPTDARTTIDNTATSTPLEEDYVSFTNHCQSGTQPGTCICAWPLENGQERVWQFIKIPLQECGLKFTKSEEVSATSTDLWLLAATDVTEQQILASELAAKNADLIQLNRLKDEFLACISHELKTPITAVMGLSTLLKDQSLGELNERQARYARLIHQSGRHLMTIVNDILDLTRMETGQLELTLAPVKIATVCDRAIEQAKTIHPKTSQLPKAGESAAELPFKHRFELVIEPELDSFIADELRLRQMLVHLLSNAFKFTEVDGEVGLRVSRWEGWVAFTVWDTGIGIPEQKQHLIFQKFQQLESPLTRQFEGTGLGLVLARALARLHGGDVSFLSKQGKGSEFTLLLPPIPPKFSFADIEMDWEGEETSSHHPTSSKRLILVVEAAPRFIEDLTEQLTGLGYRVVIARSGTEALEKARRLQPGAVFLNPLLPLLSGWDVLTLIKSDAATRQIPVVVTATRAEKDQAFSNRADEFLSLPVHQQTLQQILERLSPQSLTSQSSRNASPSVDTNASLTILYLSPGSSGLVTAPSAWLLNSKLLHQHHYRVLEADDLEQAELLARVWQPDVVLLNGAIPEPLTYLQQLSQHSCLALLPLVTLDAATTQAANQVAGLSVFPCLIPTEKLNINGLLPVLQIAAGLSWKPNLLLVDIATLTDLQLPSPSHPSRSHGVEWFQALIQYLETAGFRGMMGHSWAEVLQQVRQQSVDLLLICLGDLRLESRVLQALTILGQQHELPPFLMLPPSLSMEELLDQIQQVLAQPKGSSLSSRL